MPKNNLYYYGYNDVKLCLNHLKGGEIITQMQDNLVIKDISKNKDLCKYYYKKIWINWAIFYCEKWDGSNGILWFFSCHIFSYNLEENNIGNWDVNIFRKPIFHDYN